MSENKSKKKDENSESKRSDKPVDLKRLSNSAKREAINTLLNGLGIDKQPESDTISPKDYVDISAFIEFDCPNCKEEISFMAGKDYDVYEEACLGCDEIIVFECEVALWDAEVSHE